MTLRNTERLRMKDIIFQSQAPRTPEYYKIYSDVVNNMHDYSTIEEYNTKYSDEARQKANYLFIHFNTIGILFKDGIATADEIFQHYPPYTFIRLWEAMEINIKYLRTITNFPEFLKPFELMYQEARKKTPNYVVSWKRQ